MAADLDLASVLALVDELNASGLGAQQVFDALEAHTRDDSIDAIYARLRPDLATWMLTWSRDHLDSYDAWLQGAEEAGKPLAVRSLAATWRWVARQPLPEPRNVMVSEIATRFDRDASPKDFQLLSDLLPHFVASSVEEVVAELPRDFRFWLLAIARSIRPELAAFEAAARSRRSDPRGVTALVEWRNRHDARGDAEIERLSAEGTEGVALLDALLPDFFDVTEIDRAVSRMAVEVRARFHDAVLANLARSWRRHETQDPLAFAEERLLLWVVYEPLPPPSGRSLEEIARGPVDDPRRLVDLVELTRTRKREELLTEADAIEPSFRARVEADVAVLEWILDPFVLCAARQRPGVKALEKFADIV